MEKPTTAEQILIDLWRARRDYDRFIERLKDTPSILSKELLHPDLLADVRKPLIDMVDMASVSGYNLERKYHLEHEDDK